MPYDDAEALSLHPILMLCANQYYAIQTESFSVMASDQTVVRFNGLPVRGWLRVPPGVASANVVVLYHPTIEEEGVTPLDAAARFMLMATDASKLNIAGSNIVFACECFCAIAYLSSSIPSKIYDPNCACVFICLIPFLREQVLILKTRYRGGQRSRRRSCSLASCSTPFTWVTT